MLPAPYFAEQMERIETIYRIVRAHCVTDQVHRALKRFHRAWTPSLRGAERSPGLTRVPLRASQ